MATPDDDTTTQTAPPPPAASPDIDYKSLIQQIMQGGSGISGPAAPATPAVNPNLPVASLLGEALGGGVSPLYPMSEAQQTQAGNAALLNFGIGMLQNSSGPVRHSLGQAIASGLLGAQGSLAGVREGQAQMLDVQNKQQQMRLEQLKTALPLLTLKQQIDQAAAARQLAGGGGGGAPGGGIGVTGAPIAGSGIAPADMVGSIASTLNIPTADAAAIASNFHAESGLIPGINEIKPAPGTRGGYGLAQWTDTQGSPRRTDLEAYATANKLNVADPATQLAFMKQEIAQNYPNLLPQMAAAKTPEEKAAIFYNTYEGGPPRLLGAHTAMAAPFAALPPPGNAPGGSRTATAPPAPATPPTPVARPTAAPGGGFGTSAFNAPATTVMPAPPGGGATAPNTTAEVPPVPTPQMVAARAVAARTNKPAPIAGTDGLFVNPNGSVGLGPGGGGLGRRADISPIVQGIQTAQTTMPPTTALAAGPAAGGAVTPAAVTPPPASAFGGGAFSGPTPAMIGAPVVTPPAVTPPAVTPPVTTQQPPPPSQYPDIKAGDVTIRHPGSFADFHAKEYVPPPSTEDFNPNLTQSQQAAFDLRRQQIATLPFAEQPKAYADLTAAIQSATEGKAQAAAAAATKYNVDERTAIQTRYDTATKAYSDAAQAQLASQNKIKELQAQSGFSTEAEGAKQSFEADTQQIKKMGDQAVNAQNIGNQLQQMRTVLPGVPGPGVIASIVADNPKVVPYLTMAGAITPQQATDIQALTGMANYLSTELRPTGTGTLRIPEMDAFKSVLPQLMQTPEGRIKAVAFLQNLNDRIVQEHEFAQQYFRRPNPATGKPAYNLDNLSGAMLAPRQYDANGINRGGLGPIVPNAPDWRQGPDAMKSWINSNVDVGHPFMGWDYPHDQTTGVPQKINPKTGQKNQPTLQLMVREQ